MKLLIFLTAFCIHLLFQLHPNILVSGLSLHNFC